MRQSSNTSSAVSDESQPRLVERAADGKPGVPFSTMNIDIACRPAPVFAATKYRSACTPLVMKSLVPFRTHSLPSAERFAVVRMPATSEPAPGSVMRPR